MFPMALAPLFSSESEEDEESAQEGSSGQEVTEFVAPLNPQAQQKTSTTIS